MDSRKDWEMKYSKELKELAHNLRMGVRYCELLPKVFVQEDIWSTVLSYGYDIDGTPIWHWCHYGSSAEKATLANLEWLIRVIFIMTPAEFMKKYKPINNKQS